MMLLERSHIHVSTITSPPSSPIFTGFLFLNKSNLNFYFSPMNKPLHLQSTTSIQDLLTRYLLSKTLCPSSTLDLNPEVFLSQLQNLGTSQPMIYIHVIIQVSKLETYLFKNYYFSDKEFLIFFFFFSVFLSLKTFVLARLLL